MKKDYAHITFVLDRSGSMEDKKEQTIAGYNRFIEEQKKVPGECTATLLQFDYPRQHEYVYKTAKLADVKPLTNDTFVPRGSTALVDAIGHAIDDTGAALKALPEAERPSKIYVVILTDGEENASVEFVMSMNAAQRKASLDAYYQKAAKRAVADMIQHQKDKYGWEFVFLGADQDAIQTAAKLQIPADNTMSYASNRVGTANTFAAVTANVTLSRETNTALKGFTETQRKAALEEDEKAKP